MPFIHDVSANYHSDKPSESYACRYTRMVHVCTYIALRLYRDNGLWTPRTAIYWSFTVYISNFRSQNTNSFLKCGCSIYFFLNSAHLQCWGMVISKYLEMVHKSIMAHNRIEMVQNYGSKMDSSTFFSLEWSISNNSVSGNFFFITMFYRNSCAEFTV